MGTVINASKINDFYISGNKINGFAKSGQIVFKKEINRKYTVNFLNPNTNDFEVSGINGNLNYQKILQNQEYNCFVEIDVIIRAKEGHKITALYITDTKGLAGYIQPTGDYRFGDDFNSGHELKENEKYNIAIATV